MDSGRRYLKQIKARSAEKVYDTDSVAVFDLHKSESECFLGFQYVGREPERQHLKEFSQREHAKRIKQAKELKAQGHSFREIGKDLGVSPSTAYKYVNAEIPETPEIEIE